MIENCILQLWHHSWLNKDTLLHITVVAEIIRSRIKYLSNEGSKLKILCNISTWKFNSDIYVITLFLNWTWLWNLHKNLKFQSYLLVLCSSLRILRASNSCYHVLLLFFRDLISWQSSLHVFIHRVIF